jgi:hypothetical protein
MVYTYVNISNNQATFDDIAALVDFLNKNTDSDSCDDTLCYPRFWSEGGTALFYPVEL